ncbi:MAG: N-acetylmuramoyl-L-alanine amidase [Clostridia bacterium]|nr:N-acetylmuramoyl-L-alanine amidase [Clostridia bacterium]
MTITDMLLTPGNLHGRTGQPLTPQGIVIHYVGNPGSGAAANRNWFENGSGGSGVSSHYIVGLQGETIRCVPDNERAMHAGKSYGRQWDEMAKTNNARYIGIETCHPDTSGKFSDKTAAALAELVRYLCGKHKLNPDKDVLRHYDVTGKACPMYYVNNPAAWAELKSKCKEIPISLGDSIISRMEKYITFDKNYWGSRLKSDQPLEDVNPEYLRIIIDRLLKAVGK